LWYAHGVSGLDLFFSQNTLPVMITVTVMVLAWIITSWVSNSKLKRGLDDLHDSISNGLEKIIKRLDRIETKQGSH
jgi:sensor domain CHASE-containing protein